MKMRQTATEQKAVWRRPNAEENGRVSRSSPWNLCGAKPKDTSVTLSTRWLTGKIQHLDDLERPELQRNFFPAPKKKKKNSGNNHGIPLQNKFYPLLEIRDSEESSFSGPRERFETRFNPKQIPPKRFQKETATNSETLI